MNTPKIFCFINSNSPGWVIPVALAEDGTVLASHVSSNESFAYHDIGMNSNWNHDVYKTKYPDGFELVWLEGDGLETNAEFKKACDLNAELQKQAESSKQL